MRYIPFLTRLHQILVPRRYLEIGVRHGRSLSLAACPSLGIDPAFTIKSELHGDVTLLRTTSDEYFASPASTTGQDVFDLTFIDGMHLFEFALRDFINAERSSSRSSVIVFDDVLPRTVDEAARERHTTAWTGDVFHVIEVLRRYRPEVSTVLVDTQPTGLMVVLGLDPASTVLSENYDEIMTSLRSPDPQPVPPEILDRSAVQPPARVLEADFWRLLVEDRLTPHQDFHAKLREALAADLGPAYGTLPG